MKNKNLSNKINKTTKKLCVKLGEKELTIKKIKNLKNGDILILDKLSHEPVDIFIDNIKIGKGEIVVDDKSHLGIKITSL